MENDDGSFSCGDESGTLLARFELSSSMLRVRVNSRKRLKAAQKQIEALLGGSIERSLDAHEDVEQAVRARRGRADQTDSSSQPLELSPELARSAIGRPDAISWLREQERMLRANPQLASLDMRPLWQELALPFQGLETDPPL